MFFLSVILVNGLEISKEQGKMASESKLRCCTFSTKIKKIFIARIKI